MQGKFQVNFFLQTKHLIARHLFQIFCHIENVIIWSHASLLGQNQIYILQRQVVEQNSLLKVMMFMTMLVTERYPPTPS